MTCKDLISIASPSPSTAPPEHVQDTSSPLDTEMTCPLTSHDNGSIISGSPDLEDSEMPGFQEGRVGSGSNRGRPQGRSATISGGQYRPEIGFTANGYNGNPVGGPNNFRQYDPHSPLMGNAYGGPSRPRGSSMGVVGERPIPLSLVSPGPVWPTENQLSVAFAYGIRRNDGTYTRLVRADEIHDYLARGMPPNQGPEGLIILPQPHQMEPARRQGNEMISQKIIRTLPPNNFQRPPHGPSLLCDIMQAQIDSITAKSTQLTQRREKEYCDKWIHEGTCAFTQMGCKYKHQMPLDKATQLAVGLNHGLPNWYRRAYGNNINHSPELTSPQQMGSPPSRRTAIGRPWRGHPSLEASPSNLPPNLRTGGGNDRGKQNGNGRNVGGGNSSAVTAVQANFGPIGSPTPRSFNNTYNNPKIEEQPEDDEENDTVTYRGRTY